MVAAYTTLPLSNQRLRTNAFTRTYLGDQDYDLEIYHLRHTQKRRSDFREETLSEKAASHCQHWKVHNS